MNREEASLSWEIAPKSVKDIAASRIREMILNGILPIGERLVENELAERLGVSRVPVREALQQLALEGLIDHVQRIGWFVHLPNEAEIVEIQELRAVLEGLASRKLALRASEETDPSWVQRLRDLLDDAQTAINKDDVSGYIVAAEGFHKSLVQFAEGNILEDFHAYLMNRATLYRNLSGRITERQIAGHEGHIEILDAIVRGEHTLAERLTKEHNQRGSAGILQALETKSHDITDEKIQEKFN